MTLHTSDGCIVDNSNAFTGTLATTNCYVNAPGQATNAGCDIQSQDTRSYGAGFNANGGGVFATEWTSEKISIWFFPRGTTPGDISSGNPSPSAWGPPVAEFKGSCDIDSRFQNQQIVRLNLARFPSPLPLSVSSLIVLLGFRHDLLWRLGRRRLVHLVHLCRPCTHMSGLCTEPPGRVRGHVLAYRQS